jgi:phospholipase/carboxylesterase
MIVHWRKCIRGLICAAKGAIVMLISREQGHRLIETTQTLWTGAEPHEATAIMVAVHGRGADAGSILGLAQDLAVPGICWLAPQAPGRTWYPQSFVAPFAANEPYLSQSLDRIAGLLDAIEAMGIRPEVMGLLGFSQGACLSLETAIRRPRPYGAIIGLSGGYIGPMGTARSVDGNLRGARVFLGCSDIDSHIPLQRVHETTRLMQGMGADVTERIYPGFGHAVNEDEITEARRMLGSIGKQRPDNL